AERNKAQHGAFDLAVVFPNSPRSALEAWLARVPRRVGYARAWRNFFLTDVVPSRPGAETMHKRSVAEVKRLVSLPNHGTRNTQHAASAHQIHDYLHLVSALGANPEPLAPHLMVTPAEIKAAIQKFNLGNQSTNNRPLFGLNPGAEYGP